MTITLLKKNSFSSKELRRLKQEKNHHELLIEEYKEILRLIKRDLSIYKSLNYRDNEVYIYIKSEIIAKIKNFYAEIEEIEDKLRSHSYYCDITGLDLTNSRVANRIFVYIHQLLDYSDTIACPSYDYEVVRLFIKRCWMQHNKLLRALNMGDKCVDVRSL